MYSRLKVKLSPIFENIVCGKTYIKYCKIWLYTRYICFFVSKPGDLLTGTSVVSVTGYKPCLKFASQAIDLSRNSIEDTGLHPGSILRIKNPLFITLFQHYQDSRTNDLVIFAVLPLARFIPLNMVSCPGLFIRTSLVRSMKRSRSGSRFADECCIAPLPVWQAK